MFASDLAHHGLAPSSQSLVRSGATTFTSGATRFETLVLVMDSTSPGLTSLVQSVALMESSPPAFGIACSGLLASSPDYLNPEPTTSPHSVGWFGFTVPVMSRVSLGSPLLVLDFAYFGSLTLVRSCCRFGPASSASSCGRFDFPPPVLDLLHPGAFLPLRSAGHPGSMLLAMSAVRFGLTSSLLDAFSAEPSPTTRSFGHPDFASTVMGVARPGLLLLALDFVQLELPLLLQSLGRPGPALLVLDLLHLGLFSFLRDRA